MGLDITATARLKPAPCDKRDDCDHIHLYVNEDFPGRAEPFDTGCYTTDDTDEVSFRAGSYGGYSQWRTLLSMLALKATPNEVWERQAEFEGKPFFELVCFSDCEGVIGPVVSKKLAADFAAFDTQARECMEDYYYEKYRAWREAFERASDGGAVEFH